MILLPAMAGGGASSLLDLIGNTPLVELPALSPPGRTIYAKLEGQNPTGSIKDRVALAMVDAADLEPGPGAARADERQHRHLARARREAEGAEADLRHAVERDARSGGRCSSCTARRSSTRPASEGSNGAVRLAQEIAARDDRYVMLFQYANEANPRAHYEGTGARDRARPRRASTRSSRASAPAAR